ncbi:2'-5' RNA ligase family protein [Nocardia sp. NPDC057663]|uniref:2'-5' RNA ligase family protein n=1 Tax=Nocardia sp. NPDC057663 TaxID=3346201 RepID=UPI00366B7F18
MTSSGPFPKLLPDSTSDTDAIAQNDWNAYAEIDFLRDHWSVKQWAPGHTGYYWYLTFDSPELIELAAECQNALTQDELDNVPLDALHITIAGIGSTTTVADEQIDNLVSLARARLAEVKPFDLTIGPLTGSRSAVRFSVSPWDPLLDLHQILSMCTSESIQGLSASAGPLGARFRPHLGIAYNNTDRAADELIEAVAALRDTGPAKVRVNHVELVVLRRDGHSYRWDTRAALPLGG